MSRPCASCRGIVQRLMGDSWTRVTRYRTKDYVEGVRIVDIEESAR